MKWHSRPPCFGELTTRSDSIFFFFFNESEKNRLPLAGRESNQFSQVEQTLNTPTTNMSIDFPLTQSRYTEYMFYII